MAIQKNIKIKNRKAKFEYEILDTFTAGIVLRGTEIKAIREGKASIAESFCEFSNSELFAINMTVQEYSHATHFSHAPKSERKLLLNRSELKKLEKEVKNSGLQLFRWFSSQMTKVWRKLILPFAAVKRNTTSAKP